MTWVSGWSQNGWKGFWLSQSAEMAVFFWGGVLIWGVGGTQKDNSLSSDQNTWFFFKKRKFNYIKTSIKLINFKKNNLDVYIVIAGGCWKISGIIVLFVN